MPANEKTHRTQPGTTFLTFSAPSQHAVDAFFSAALRAGGRNHGEPGVHDQQLGHYSAAVFDFDNNSIEVIHRAANCDDGIETRSLAPSAISESQEGSRVLTWQKEVARSTAGSEVSVRSSKAPLQPIVNNISAPTYMVTQTATPPIERRSSGDTGSKAIVGTLLGAAAGAALAYIMTKGESESSQSQPQQQNNSNTFTGLSQIAQNIYRAIESIPVQTDPAPSVSQPATNVNKFPREYQHPSSASYVTSTISPRSQHQMQNQRAIEAPPALLTNGDYTSQGYIIMQDNTSPLTHPSQSRYEYTYAPNHISASGSPRSHVSVSRSYSDDLVARSQQNSSSPSQAQDVRSSLKRSQTTDVLAVAVATISGARTAINAIEKALGPESVPLPASPAGSVLMGPGDVQYKQPTTYVSVPPPQASPSKAPSVITAIRTVPPPSRPGSLVRAITTEYIPTTSSPSESRTRDEERDRPSQHRSRSHDHSSSASHSQSRPKSSSGKSESGRPRSSHSSHSHSKSRRSSPGPRRKSKLNEVITPDDSISQISVNRSTTSSASDDDQVTVVKVKDKDREEDKGSGSRRHRRRENRDEGKRTVVSLPVREREREKFEDEKVKGRSIVGVGKIMGGRGFGLLKGSS